MVSRLASIAVGHGLEPWLCQTEDHKIGICCFSLKHVAFIIRTSESETHKSCSL